MLGYGLKMARIPRRLVITRSGCFLNVVISSCEAQRAWYWDLPKAYAQAYDV